MMEQGESAATQMAREKRRRHVEEKKELKSTGLARNAGAGAATSRGQENEKKHPRPTPE